MRTNNREPEHYDMRAPRLDGQAVKQSYSPADMVSVDLAPGTLLDKTVPVDKVVPCPPASSDCSSIDSSLAEVFDAIKDQFSLKDKAGRITYANQAFLQFYDRTIEQVVGKPCQHLLPEQMIDICSSTDREVLEFGKTVCVESQWRDSKSGEQYWSETHKSPQRNAEGEIIGIVCVSRDITERRAAEEELKRQKKLLELIIETVPDWIFVKDDNLRVILANRAFYENSHFTPTTTIGCNPTDTFPHNLKKISAESDAYVLEEGKPLCREVVSTTFDGTEKHLEVRKLPLIENGKVAGIVGVCRDLTDTKTGEREAKRNEAMLLHAARLSSLGELAAGIAHEVNQPLFSILNYAKAVENKLQDEDNLDIEAIREWTQRIYSEASRGGKIIRRIKSFVQPAEATRKLSEINKLVLDSIDIITIESQDAGATIETLLAEELPALLVDRIQIQQVLVNLLKNALEACSEQKGKTPHILVTTLLNAGNVEIHVTDNGPGLSTSEDTNLLDPFQTTKQDGMGLGLAISNTIIEAHLGKMTYHANKAGGMTFQFTLPTESN